ncbi:MAG: hypothetical protein ACKVPX_15000 [Myxococcaceae bacterium]
MEQVVNRRNRRNRRNRLLAAAVALAISACAPLTRSVVLEVPNAPANSFAVARFQVPKSWVPFDAAPARAEFLGPDRRSRAYLRALPASQKPEKCERLVSRYADDVIDSWGGPPHTRVVRRENQKNEARFELRRTDPKPHGETIWSRIRCERGALAVASCTVPSRAHADVQDQCRNALGSLELTVTR